MSGAGNDCDFVFQTISQCRALFFIRRLRRLHRLR
jgi:hypothetical protein